MAMRLRHLVAVTLALSGAARAETALDCAALTRIVEDFSGYAVSADPRPMEGDWCVLDGARLTGSGLPSLAVQRFRVKGRAAADVPVVLGVDIAGAKLSPKAGEAPLPDWVLSMLRLQTADLTLFLYRNEAENKLEVRPAKLVLSGGTEVEIEAKLSGAGLSRAALLAASVTELRLRWRNDGRTLRPMMEAAGAALGATGGGVGQVDAARAVLQSIAKALPADNLIGGSLDAVTAMVRDMPQGRGRMVLEMTSAGGIGAAQLGLLALADDPKSAAALDRFLGDAVVLVDWQPGLGN